MKKSLLILSIFMSLLLVLFACSANNTKSQVDYGYLRLDGSMTNREAYVDGRSVGIDPEYDANTIPLRVGTHHLEIRSKNRILLADDIVIEPNKITQVTVP
ncbi:MAG TPA: hypothetical protein PKH17_04540 [Candidatus Syntrophosphaera sp.]|nr:hypothetical protein [Candidatus Syntrophosphaera sp.]OQB07073.1 MAG: hypothetical protein BWY18_00563 [Candidatus Cloacimonetes bacterium ADurb.Bin211]HOD59993.1 hypothetical protein [Candidatus Syntrophosphaera sp.]